MNDLWMPGLTLVGTVLVVVSGYVGVRIKARSDSVNAKAATVAADAAAVAAKASELEAETNQLQALWRRLDEQDQKIDALQELVEELKGAQEREREAQKAARHRLKGAVAYAVGVANQAIATILEFWTDAEIGQLPEPLRAHVRGDLDFTDHLDLTRNDGV